MIVNFEKNKLIFNVNNNKFEYMMKHYGLYSVYTDKLYIQTKPQKIGKIYHFK